MTLLNLKTSLISNHRGNGHQRVGDGQMSKKKTTLILT